MELQSLITLLSPVVIYEGGYQLAQFIASYITPFLLTIALAIRTLETQLDAVSNGHGRWGRFIRDMGVWITVLAVYFVLAQMINQLFTSLYTAFSSAGSLAGLMEQFSALLMAIQANGQGADTLDGFTNLLSSPLLLMAYFVFYVSFILVAFVAVLMQLAHAIAYSCAVSWGLVAIPMSLTTTFKLLAAWGKFTAIILVWPVFHYIAFALFTPLFMEAARYFIDGTANSVTADKAQVYLVFTVINLLACALIVAAPFIAQSLITNGAVTGVIAPFAAAAMGATATVARIGKERALSAGASAISGVRHSANDGMINHGLSKLGSILKPSANHASMADRAVPASTSQAFRPESLHASPAAVHTPTASQAAAASMVMGTTPESANTTANAATSQHPERRPATDAGQQETDAHKRKQTRRGVIIQQHKLGKPQPT